MTHKISLGLVGLLVPGVLAGVGSVVHVGTGTSLPAAVAVVSAATMFWLPDLRLKHAASERRHELRRALACYLDLVSMSLAGGRGVPEALPGAAALGSGWAFGVFRQAVEQSRYTGETPWAALAAAGERLGVVELVDVGGALQLVADDGARVRASLAARASTQRRRQLAETEGEAAKADQSMEMAQVVLALGFFLFLGFPAVVAVLGI